MTKPLDTDVLIVGAGPTGLMLANQLARAGVRARIIDRHAGPATQTRALGVQARTLEIYAHLGIVERSLELGRRAEAANIWVLGRRTARVALGEFGSGLSPYPFLLSLGQDDNERLLGEALRGSGGSVEWNTELVALSQANGRAVATVRTPDGSTTQLAAAWVAGCDGARSAVRELNGVAFLGAPYQHVFYVADTRLAGPMVPGELNVYLWREGFHLFFPMRGSDHWRIVGILPPELRGREDLTLDEVSPSIRREAGAELSFLECNWFSTYRIHHRRAEHFRVGRCFLLGDAAHIHSPVGAQGMNTGLQDAYNLGWKLALVLSGGARESLLDSYEEERLPVARRLLVTTDRAFSLVVSDSPLAGVFRTRVLAKVMALAMRRPRFQRIAFRTISQIGIRYPASSLSQTLPGMPEQAPRAGDRFPWVRLSFRAGGPAEDLFGKLDDTRWTLIAVGQPVPREAPDFGGRLDTLVVAGDSVNEPELERARIPRPSFYLLRPDGHVGLCGTRLDVGALKRYAAERIERGTES